ncbi:MAG: LysR family transcriptional regulator [Rhodospirillales bacterium]|nr:LysR family transcriptional regulator [Rhodospirillales bacterium]
MQTLPSFNALKAFEAAVRRGSFSAAANELHLTPSAVSHQVKILENQLGIRLFRRIGRSVVPTARGAHYYREVTAAFGRIRVATVELTGDGMSDRLSVHSAPSFAVQVLLPHLPTFVEAHPELDVVFWATSPPYDAMADTYDVDIQHRGRVTTDLDIMQLPAERIVPMCSPRLAEGARPIRSPEDLLYHSLIHSDLCSVRWPDWLEHHFDLPLDLDRGLHFDRSFMSIGAAVDGMGVCLESTLLARRELAEGLLVKPLADDGPEVHAHRLACRIEEKDLPKIVTFKNWLRRLLVEAPPEDTASSA